MPRLSDTPSTTGSTQGNTGRDIDDKPLAERSERRSQVRGLLWLALAAIVFAILRAGVHRVFTVGWWWLW
jgi:hypothetical protein